MRTILHVDQFAIRRNLKHGTSEPVLSVKTYKSNTKCHTAVIHGPSELVYRPAKPLSCGARVWISTMSEVTCR